MFSVDLFNEGVDLPAVDTVVMLRPTESPTLFLQQLGRGLRRSPGKGFCTVLDFVGTHRREFRFDRRYRALLGGTRRELERGAVSSYGRGDVNAFAASRAPRDRRDEHLPCRGDRRGGRAWASTPRRCCRG